MPASCQADPHTGVDTAIDLALMVICHVGAGHPVTVPRAIVRFRYLYITIDKLTKWLEETPVVKINKQYAVKFIKSIV
jgi:hypothetical protein